MTVCKHCGTEIEDGLEYCPNCGQSIEEFGDFFEPDERLEEEAYNIFDTPEEFDMDSLLEREFEQGVTEKFPFSERVSSIPEEEFVPEPVLFPEEEQILLAEEKEPENFDSKAAEEPMQPAFEEQDDLAELLGLFSDGSSEEEAVSPVTELPVTDILEEMQPEQSIESLDGMEFPIAEETDFFALDDLFQDLDAEPAELQNQQEIPEHGLEELLAAGEVSSEEKQGKKKKDKKKKEDKKSLFQTLFGNVPIDPSKIKPEPTPEQIAEKKQKDAEAKKAKDEAKKLATEEKKQIAEQNKQEKARQKALAKEEKKAKKLQQAKLILEEMQETRINRVGATIVFLFFVACAIAIFSGSEIFGYEISIHNAEKNFNKAYNNNVKYYTDAYNDIYGLVIKPEDQILSEKIKTVMFVNKELNSYNSYMVLEDYQAALHSLLLGLYRYGKYYEQAIPLGIKQDMDYVRTQILKELKATFDVSEDEAEVLRDMLYGAGVGGMNTIIDPSAAREYNLALYKIVEESEVNDDSDN